MAAEEGGGVIVRFTYTGAEGERIPREATHITIAAVKIVPAEAFAYRRNIIEVICHENVEKIERMGFAYCPSLRRVIMPGVEEVELGAFWDCEALTDVECGKLKTIGYEAFGGTSLKSINLPSIKIVKELVFENCKDLTDVKFGSKLERFDQGVFYKCPALERITLPLKDGIVTSDNTFQGCENLVRVDLVEEDLLNETVAALHLEEWRNDMYEVIDSINQTLPTTYAGYYDDDDDDDEVYDDEDYGEKAQAIRWWIISVRSKLIHYQAEHQRLLDQAANTLQLNLPRDIAMNNILTFLELPPQSFELGDQADEDDEVLWDEDNEEDSHDEEGDDSMSWEEDDEEEDY